MSNKKESMIGSNYNNTVREGFDFQSFFGNLIGNANKIATKPFWELEQQQRQAAEQQRQAQLAEQQRQAQLAEQQRQAQLAEQQRQAQIAEQQRQAQIAEQQRLAAAAVAAAEAKKNTAITDAKTAANAAITAADAAVSLANTGGSSKPEMDAKTAANNAKTAATASLTAANGATTLQAAIDAKAAADKAKAEADNAKKSAQSAIDAAAASSAAEKKSEIKKNIDAALSISTQQISPLTKPETFVVNSSNLSSGTGISKLFDKIVDFFSPFKEGFGGSGDDLFTNVNLKIEQSRTILAKTSPPATASELNDALRLSIEAVTEAQSIRTNLLACSTSPRPTIKFNANTGAFPVAPAVPADGSLYWTTDGAKNYLILSKKDASSPAVNVESTLVYCGRKDKFIILYDSNIVATRKFIQYKIISATITSTHVKYEVVIVSNTQGFSKTNVTNGQAVYISTNNIQTQMATGDGTTASNPCSGPNPSANCKPVCIPTDPSGNIKYKEGSTTQPLNIYTNKPQWNNNYFEYQDVKGIGSDGILLYYPMDSTQTFVGNGTDCNQSCPPRRSEEDTSIRPLICRPPLKNWGEKPAPGQTGECPTGCTKVLNPTSRRNASACKFDKVLGTTCGAVCDFNVGSECKTNTDCANCVGVSYTAQFSPDWRPSITRTIEKIYSPDDCKSKCKKASKENALTFLQLQQSGAYLESRCRKIGTSGKKVICGPITNTTQTGMVAGYDMCITCKLNKELFSYFEYEKRWNEITKQWDFINITEIPSPSSTWFEGDSNSFSSSGGGSGAGSGGSGGGTNLRGSKPSSYREDSDTRDARDSRELGEIRTGTNSKSISISSASQNEQRQRSSAKVAALKLQIDKMKNEYASLVDNIKWNKMQMDKAENDCYDINTKLRRAIKEYSIAEAISIRSGATTAQKKDTEAANTLMYNIKQKAKEICNNYDNLKSKYMNSVSEMNVLKNKIADVGKQYDNANADLDRVGGGGSGGGSFLGSAMTPIINIFFGDDANRDCSGQLGCGKGVDYSFPSPFNSSKGGMFTPQPFYGGIRL